MDTCGVVPSLSRKLGTSFYFLLIPDLCTFPEKTDTEFECVLVFDYGILGDSVVLQRAMFGHEIAQVNYLIVFCFIFVRASVAQRAVQALVVVVSLDIFEDFSTCFDLGGEDLIARKALTLERTEERFRFGIVITISYPTHAEIGSNNAQRFA